jgi:hypothetical protein
VSFRVQSTEALKDLERVQADMLASVRQVLGQLAALAVAHARATAVFKDRTGNLRNSIKREAKGSWAQFVKAGGKDAPYAQWIEAGSRAHEIKARRVNFLRFEQNGQVVFRKRVFHPGTKPGRFMQSARDSAESVATQYLEAGLNAAINR